MISSGIKYENLKKVHYSQRPSNFKDTVIKVALQKAHTQWTAALKTKKV